MTKPVFSVWILCRWICTYFTLWSLSQYYACENHTYYILLLVNLFLSSSLPSFTVLLFYFTVLCTCVCMCTCEYVSAFLLNTAADTKTDQPRPRNTIPGPGVANSSCLSPPSWSALDTESCFACGHALPGKHTPEYIQSELRKWKPRSFQLLRQFFKAPSPSRAFHRTGSDFVETCFAVQLMTLF